MGLPADLIYHEIAASNMLVGDTKFLVLPLPSAWEISIGAGRPEVTASHVRDEQRWVASGDAWYVLYNEGRRWAMELRLSAKPAGRFQEEPAVPELTVAGHPAAVSWASRRRGLIKRWSVTYVTVTFYCAKTGRRLSVEFSGRLPDEAFREMVETARYIRCH